MDVTATVEALLYEEEGSALDFKRDQYPFAKANIKQKAELLKDILAFANSWRRTDAYILVGIKEVRGGRSIVVGVSIHLEDADLQQFVNSKLNRPLLFSYIAIEMEGKQVGVIHIPSQKRPFFLKERFGKLKASTVYIRRGSSTDEATPDEIALMGQDAQAGGLKAPKLSAYFVAGKHDEIVEKNITVHVIDARIPEKAEFPQYAFKYDLESAEIRIASVAVPKNPDFYYKYAKYLQEISRVRGLKLAVRNEGNAVARDVKVVITIKEPLENLIVLHEDDLPDKPSPDLLAVHPRLLRVPNVNPDIFIKTMPTSFVITCELAKIQAMDSVMSGDTLCIGAYRSRSVECSVEIFSDDLEAPINDTMHLDISVAEKPFDVSDFVESENE